MLWEYRISYDRHHLTGGKAPVEALAAILHAADVEHYVHRRALGVGEPGPWILVPA